MRTLRTLLRHTALGEFAARSPLRPQYWKASYAAARTLWSAYGHLKSVRSGSAVDAAGQPVPWYTYPAIEFLKQFDFAETIVFEYGSGNSTRFWGNRAARVISVEDDEQWYESLVSGLPSNCALIFEPDLHKYVDVIRQFAEGFDIVVVDGPARGLTRLKCARAAVDHLRPGGMIILDNSDWLPESARYLRESGLLQVDMSGFIPIGGHTQTTSFNLDRRLCRRSRSVRA
jgi:Methyltransferase domain